MLFVAALSLALADPAQQLFTVIFFLLMAGTMAKALFGTTVTKMH